MNTTWLIKNATIVNEGKKFLGGVVICDGMIQRVFQGISTIRETNMNVLDAKQKLLIPGVIDDQVHFREPGLTEKGDIYSESRAAVSGGITSYMEMPNTKPPATTQELLAEKFEIAAKSSLANYSFYMGATNSNIEEVMKTNPKHVCGIKVFMGSSTGNMLVDNPETLSAIFSQSPMLIAVHCEDESIIQQNIQSFREKYGEEMPVSFHPHIRNAEACYTSSSLAVNLARKYGTRLHLLHLSTEKETELLDNTVPLSQKKITAEVCVHHLFFDDSHYESLGSKIKWNPAIKTSSDKTALLRAVLDDKIDVIATDHAPHLWQEKEKHYFECPSGGPLVQHSLVAMLELYHDGKISLEKMVEKMCHAPATLFRIDKRGFIKPGYFADLVIVDLDECWKVKKSNITSKCHWSPFEGATFRSMVKKTFVNGELAFDDGEITDHIRGMRLQFNY